MTDSPNSLAEAQRLIEAGELSTVFGVLGELADEVYEAAMLAGIAANRLGDLIAAAARFQRDLQLRGGARLLELARLPRAERRLRARAARRSRWSPPS